MTGGEVFAACLLWVLACVLVLSLNAGRPERRQMAIRRERERAHREIAQRHAAKMKAFIREQYDGLTCDICGAELAHWAAADEHIDKEHTP